jgi:hypothetical protein
MGADEMGADEGMKSARRAAIWRRPVLFLLLPALALSTWAHPSVASALPTVSIGNVSVAESNSGTTQAVFTVTISARTKHASVRWQTKDGTALAPDDYAAASGTLRFNGPHLTRQIAISVNGDTAYERNEAFSVTLSAPQGVTVTDPVGAGTIVNDDAPPVFSAADVSVPEGDAGQQTFASVPVSLAGATELPATVEYATIDGTASSTSDYVSTTGTLTFVAGETTKTVLVPIVGDNTPEADETVTLQLSGPSGATLGTSASTVTIIDNDSPPPVTPTLSVGNASVREGDSGTSTLKFPVSLSATSASDVTVDYLTADGTASSTSDYQAASGVLTIVAGQTTATLSVLVDGDRRLERNETIFLNLSNPTGAYVVAGQGRGTIRNDDTRTTMRIRHTARRIRAKGTIAPAGSRRRISVTLYQLRKGVFVRVAGHRLLSSRAAVLIHGIRTYRYSTSFRRPSRGTCRVVSQFKKTAVLGASSARRTFRC